MDINLGNCISDWLHKRLVEASGTGSNLNDEFRKWFGNSKVVDTNGKPLVFFHGTTANFDTFTIKRRGAFGTGYYFTTDLKEARDYGKNIMSVYLKLDNPATTADVQAIMTSIPDVRYMDDGELSARTTELLMQSKFDGLMFYYQRGDILAMVIDPNQIKSVENDGTWDMNDNNIYS